MKVFCVTFHFPVRVIHFAELFILRYTSPVYTSLTLTPSHQIFTFAFVIFNLLAEMRSFLSCDTPAASINQPHSHIRFSHLYLWQQLFSNYVYLAIHQQPVYTKGVSLTLTPLHQIFTFTFVTTIGNYFQISEMRYFLKMSHTTIIIGFFSTLSSGCHMSKTNIFILWPNHTSFDPHYAKFKKAVMRSAGSKP